MKRFSELVEKARNQYHNDDFFENFERNCQDDSPLGSFYNAYEKAFMSLEDKSWQVLKEKALRHFLDHREGQKKQGFFNILNEAFAYNYLMNSGYENIEIISEMNKKGQRTPDISFLIDNDLCFCEVKTKNTSKDEIDRRANNYVVYDTENIYSELRNKFFDNLKEIINGAKDQIKASENNSIIFIILIFDDFTFDFIENYKSQLIDFIRKEKYNNLVMQIGIIEKKEYLLIGNPTETETNP